jgi:hypothetical protein
MRILSVLALGLAAVTVSAAAPKAKAPANCVLTQTDKIKNRALSWVDFDQGALVPTNWHSLEERGCHLVAAEAAADYLANGPMPESERWHTTTRFHMAQSLALGGRHLEASKIAATARCHVPVGNMDWNSYLSGTYAFLAGDKTQLVTTQKRLAASSSSSDFTNNGVLIGLTHCFNQPYKIAYDLKCRLDGRWAPPTAEGSSSVKKT